MNKNIPRIPEEYVMPLNMNGLKGRMLRLKPKRNSKREFLIVYGHHSTLERWYSLAQVMNDFGGVTMPDLPGFGGMDSFYKIGETPDLDTMADYLASFVKLRYKNRRISLVGLSYGFLVVTRMLQKYPELAKKVDLLVSIVGFVHKDDFVFTLRRRNAYLLLSKTFKHRLPSFFYRKVLINPFVLKRIYHHTFNAKHKFTGLTEAEREATVEFELHLWKVNEARTYMATSETMLTVDNCQVKVDLPVIHISVKQDNYFDRNRVEQHMRVTFNDYIHFKANLDKHTPSIIADKKQTSDFIPKGAKALLRKKPLSKS